LNRVEPIRNFSDFEKIQDLLMEDNKVKECLLLVFMYNTNLRVKDALSIKWNMLFDDDGYIKEYIEVRECKTRRYKKTPKRQPITKQLREILLTYWLKYRPRITNYVFRSESPKNRGRNQAWNGSYVWRFINEYARKVGIKYRVGAHSLRKTFGYHAVKNGISIEELSQMLNHSNVAITKRYCGIADDEIKANYETVSKLNNGAIGRMAFNNLPDKKKRGK